MDIEKEEPNFDELIKIESFRDSAIIAFRGGFSTEAIASLADLQEWERLSLSMTDEWRAATCAKTGRVIYFRPCELVYISPIPAEEKRQKVIAQAKAEYEAHKANPNPGAPPRLKVPGGKIVTLRG
jgi:hypothetical protein